MKDRKIHKGMKVVIYLRISQDRDDQQSIENQEREARAYAQLKGWEVVAVLSDVGKSGYKRGVKRPGFDQAMSMVQTRQADIFLVWKVSRFIRRIREFHMFLDDLLKAGGTFDSVTDPVDYTTASGELLLAMTAGFAQMESAAKADFSKSWNDGRTAKGAVPQGPRPFGYDRLERDKAPRNQHGHAVTLVPNPLEAEAIRFSAEWLLTGKSLRSAVKELNMIGSKEKPLTSRGLKSALLNPTTAGLRAVKDEDGKVTKYVQGCWKAILDRDEWEAVGELLNDPSRSSHHPGTTEVRHLLSGIMSCGKDGCSAKFGSRIWKQGNARNYRYTCFNCYNSATEAVVDAAVKARLLDLVDQEAWTQLRQQGRGYDPAVIKAIEDEQMGLAKMWKSKDITMEVFQMMNAELVTRMAQATGAEPLDLPDVENLADSWDTMKVKDKRRVLNVVFSQIKLDPANGTRDTISRLFMRRAV